ncbi:hypothetical protein Pcinc_026543 [Petrolisthes cinctipes]|uniref:Uncharacterized protein n=1 Tax=Petrolisthes cinctipes TaxID=88211 RepID=A0AAE1F780_PETCI|nr:hypothetical protein Pcinc_026543 [Petrolisthes cinctipes]
MGEGPIEADVSGESSVNQRARPEKEARGRDRRYKQGQRAQIKGQGQRVQAGTEGKDKRAGAEGTSRDRGHRQGQGQKVQTGTESKDKGRGRRYKQGQEIQTVLITRHDINVPGTPPFYFVFSRSLPHSLRPSHASPVPALATPLPALDFALNPVVHNNRHSCSLSHPPAPSREEEGSVAPITPAKCEPGKTSGVTSRPALTSPPPGNIDEVTHVAASLEKQPGHGIINTSINQAKTRKTRLEHFSQVTITKKLSVGLHETTRIRLTVRRVIFLRP